MFSTPAGPGIAAVQSALIALFLLGVGYLLADRLLSRREFSEWVRTALAVPALLAYAFLLALVHIATGGLVFSNPWLVRAIVLATAAVLVAWKVLDVRRHRSTGERLSRRDRALLAVIVLASVMVWGIPITHLLPVDMTADLSIHMGWTAQLLNGESTPSAALIGDIPNAYPWLFHFVSAFVSVFTPGGTAFHGQGALQLLLAAGTVMLLFGIGRELTGSFLGGSCTALLGALCGGLGFLFATDRYVIIDPEYAARHYLVDLVFVRPYNVSFHNLAPAFPRDLSLVFLLAFLLFAATGLARRRASLLIAGGCFLGLAGLTHPDSFFVGLAIAAFAALLSPEIGRLKSGAALIVPAGLVWAVWLAPVLVNRWRYGFNDFSGLPRELPVLPIVVAWGITTPLALYALIALFPRLRARPGVRVALAALLGALLLLVAASVIPEVVGSGSTTLGYRKRYWSLVHLGVVLFAGLGLTALIERAGRSRRVAAVALGAVAVVLASASPLVASTGLASRLEKIPERDLFERSVEGERTLLELLAPRPGMRCNVAVPIDISFRIFSYTGYRHVWFSRGRSGAFIRWRTIWDEIPTREERKVDNRILIQGTQELGEWENLAEKYDLDAVVTTAAESDAPSFASFPKEPVLAPAGHDYVVVWRRRCPPAL